MQLNRAEFENKSLEQVEVDFTMLTADAYTHDTAGMLVLRYGTLVICIRMSLGHSNFLLASSIDILLWCLYIHYQRCTSYTI